MPYKTILVHLNNERRAGPLLECAAALGDKFGAHVIGLYNFPAFRLTPPVPMPFGKELAGTLRGEMREDERRIVAERLQERLNEEPDAADNERRPEYGLGRALIAVAIRSRQVRRQRHAHERCRRRADQHPHRQPRMDMPELPVSGGAERLEDRSVQDVGADRDRRLEAEDEDQHGRHQRTTTHPRHSDEETDQQSRN